LQNFLKILISKHKLIATLAVIDFKEQFSGSYLGVLWAIIRSLIFIGVIWFLFSSGMKMNLIDEKVPFILYLLAGFAAWNFFSNGLGGLTSAFSGNRSLVKNPSFEIAILPFVKILSAFIFHGIFLFITIAVLIYSGFYPSIYWLQLPFYIFMLITLLLGFGFLVGTLSVFAKDINHFVGAVLQVGFWMTPIFWSLDIIPPKYMWLLNFNPMVYIVNGYRNTFLNHTWFWQDTSFLLSYVVTCVLFLVVGLYTYKKLKPHFGDVL